MREARSSCTVRPAPNRLEVATDPHKAAPRRNRSVRGWPFFVSTQTAMIDIDTEELLTFAQAATLFPSPRTGKPIALNTLYRWASKGYDGIVLESVKLGRHRLTSREAVKRFARYYAGDSAGRPAPSRSSDREARTTEILRRSGLGESSGERT